MCSTSSSRASTAARSAATPSRRPSASRWSELLEEGTLQERSRRLGEHALSTLRGAALPGVKEVRGSGLWWAVELDGTGRTGREISLELLARGILAKDTHTWAIRFAPPLVVSEADLDHALATIIDVLT